jgi:uncharacterized protein
MSLNLNNLRTPGVYIDEVSLLPPSVAGVQTGIPAFVGYTQRASLKGEDYKLVPTRITSMREYELYFGLANTEGPSLSVVVNEYFVKRKVRNAKGVEEDVEVLIEQFFKADLTSNIESGAKVAKPSVHNMYYAVQLYFLNGGGPCYIVSVGDTKAESVVAADLTKGLEALLNEDEPTILVFPEAIHIDGNHTEIYDAALSQAARLQDRFVIMDVKTDTDPTKTSNDAAKAFRSANLNIDYLKYGAAYYPYLESTIDYNFGEPDKSKIKIKYQKVLDGTKAPIADGYTITGDGGGTVAALDELRAKNSSLYEKARVALASLPIILPPSAAMAGIYARVDSERGVWKAPANVSIAGITGPAVKISDQDQTTLNVDDTAGKSINAIRTLTGRGTLVWGARTLAGNDSEWRYISTRRFFNFVEESVKKATMRFVFEPNDANTWVRVRGMIENFLTLQWRQGALQGVKPEQAFFVRVGLGQTMTSVDILEGRMIVEIGMAVVRPAEFIILRFSHKMAEA